MRNAAGYENAFTLLEMIAALTLMMVLAVAMYTSLFAAYRAKESAERSMEPVRKASLALSMIKDDFDSVMAPRGILAAEFTGQYVQDETGLDTHVIVMHTASNSPTGESPACDIRRVEFALEKRGDSGKDDIVLVRRIITNLLAPVRPDPVTEVLCRGINNFNVSYFTGEEWVDSWDSIDMGNVLPRAVEVSIELIRNGDEKPGIDPSVYSMSRIFLLRPAFEGMSIE